MADFKDYLRAFIGMVFSSRTSFTIGIFTVGLYNMTILSMILSAVWHSKLGLLTEGLFTVAL